MKYTVSVSSPVSTSFRVASIIGKFNYPKQKETTFAFEAELPTDREDWQVGIIVGPSGSGKSLLARQAFPIENIVSGFSWKGKAIVDDFPDEISVDDITRALTSVGLSSVPAWMSPYSALSNGQKFRADLARALASSDNVVYDEFTSVVDRDVARTAAYAVSKAVRRTAKQKFVAVSCHADIVEWLEPDWVFNTGTGSLHWGRLRRPQIRLRIYRGEVSAWKLFSRHHYLTGNIHAHAQTFLCYVSFGDSPERLVGFDSYIPMAGHAGVRQRHRTVVLPDFQGAGIGMRMHEETGEIVVREKKCRIFGITSSPILNKSRARSPRWKLTRKPSRASRDHSAKFKSQKIDRSGLSRLTCSWIYVPRPTKTATYASA